MTKDANKIACAESEFTVTVSPLLFHGEINMASQSHRPQFLITPSLSESTKALEVLEGSQVIRTS